MIKKIVNFFREGAILIFGTLFVLVAAPIIRLSGLDKTDTCPYPEDIEKANRHAKQLNGELSK